MLIAEPIVACDVASRDDFL